MEKNNKLPVAYIIAETKTNTDELREYLASINSSIENNMKMSNNGLPVKDLEAFIEIISKLTDEEEWLDKSKIPNKQYIANIIKKDEFSPNSALNHSSATVLFDNVSMLFVKKLLQQRMVGLVVSDKAYNLPSFSFWIPPSFETDPKLMIAYAQVFSELNTIKNKLCENMKLYEISNADELRKKIQDISRIFPWGLQVNCGITAGFGTWRHLFHLCTDFHIDDEQRRVFLFLAKKMKSRYLSIFQDMVIEDVSGKQFGIDTINSHIDAWKLFRIKFKADVEKNKQ